MNIDAAILLFPIVFMLHEFEEIVLFKNWVAKHKTDPRLTHHVWIKKYSSHPISTATFSVMVAEEFLIISSLSVLAAGYNLYAMFAGLLIAYAVHLVGHVGAWIHYRRYVPGAASALLTLPLIAWIFYTLNTHVELIAWQVGVWALCLGAVLLGNLLLLHTASSWIENRIKKS